MAAKLKTLSELALGVSIRFVKKLIRDIETNASINKDKLWCTKMESFLRKYLSKLSELRDSKQSTLEYSAQDKKILKSEYPATENINNLKKYLASVLLQNERLQMKNTKLKKNVRSKEEEITALMDVLCSSTFDLKHRAKIQQLKEKIGDFNIRMQKLRNELSALSKKLENERGVAKRNESSTRSLLNNVLTKSLDTLSPNHL